MQIAVFLARGLAWGMAGLSLAQWSSPGRAGLWLIIVAWLAGLAFIGWATAAGSKSNRYNFSMTWAGMAIIGVSAAFLARLMGEP
jgi:hypothetical protein